MANTKLSALTELAEAPATGDEIYIRDISEAASAESKRITWGNLFTALDCNKISLGSCQDSQLYYDGTDTFLNLRAVGTGDLMIALGPCFPSPDPGAVHIWNGTAGSITADANALLVLESSDNAFIQFLSPDLAAISFGDGSLNAAGKILYRHSTNAFEIRINNVLNLKWRNGCLAFQGAYTISTTACDLTINPSGDLIITAGGGDVIINDQVTITAPEVALDVTNTTDGVSNQVMTLRGANATRADDDEIYQSWYMANSAGSQVEMARSILVAQDVTACTEDSQIQLQAMRAGTLNEYIRYGSQGPTGVRSVIINNGALDIDFRVASNNISSMFVIDAGQDAISLGGTNVDGSALALGNIQLRTLITSVGHQLHIPAQTSLFDNPDCPTIPIGSEVFFGIPTWNNTVACAVGETTVTIAATVYIQGAPVGTACNVTLTATHALFIDGGSARFDGAILSNAGAQTVVASNGNLASANGVASFCGAITNLTIVNGIVTAAS